MKMRKLAVTMLGTMLLAGCSTEPGVQVTRFHLNQPIAAGQISVEPMMASDHGSPEFQTYANIVGAELARIGFTEAAGLDRSEQVAVIQVDRMFFDGPPRSSFSIGIGGGNFGWHGGAGGSVGTTIAGKPTQNVATRLIVQIKRRSDGTTIWEGRAETHARFGTPESQPAAAVQHLASAVFQGFPGVSGRTISVK
jgi:hypothetical protein